MRVSSSGTHACVHLQSDRETARVLFVCAVYTRMCVCLYHVLECKRVVAHVVCLCLNQPVNTHVGCLSFLPWECVTIYVKLKALAVG